MQQNVFANSFPADERAAVDETAYHVVDVEIGRRIKRRRQQLKMSQTALGAAVGVSFQQIQKYERGHNRVSASTLYEMALLLSVPMAFFFEGLQNPLSPANGDLNRKAILREEFVATDEGQRLVDAFTALPKKMRLRFISLLSAFETDE
ncbi:transcriptional regulator with XRE-family HTH domain [Rhizobium sp. BK650]|uniref:helix-turn-helix domain-containing protein n=1 Tax=Rhizobium sp. BK650 TaxID=2586990 RepID=UPI00160D6894|nr:helix-turn-helix transcriptional regulator [Rhizobium sp. BK650]MBB3659716.1 transcriptional regulator with XRE-family HTH domain [Rhizobium sp. BK650]